MLDDAQLAFCRAAGVASLFARRRDGSPTGWPMTPLVPGDGYLYYNTYRSAAKALIIARDPRVATLVIGSDRALEIVADAPQVTDPGELADLIPRVLRDDGFVQPAVLARTQERLRTGKRILLRMVPRRVRWVELPDGFRSELPTPGTSAARGDSGRAGRDRGSLALDVDEIRDFLRRAPSGVLAQVAEDGYLSTMPVALGLADDRVSLSPAPPAGAQVAVVVDRGATYDDIIGAIVHGTVDAAGSVPLDAVVSFEFARATR